MNAKRFLHLFSYSNDSIFHSEEISVLPYSMNGNFFIINCRTFLPSSVSRSLLLDSELDLLYSNTKENSTGFTPLSLSAHLWRLIWAFSKAISRFKLGSN